MWLVKDGIGDRLVRRLTCGGGKRGVGRDFKRFQLDGCVCGVVIGVREQVGGYCMVYVAFSLMRTSKREHD